MTSAYNRQYQRRIKIGSKEATKRNPRQSFDSDAYTEVDQQSPEMRGKRRPQKLQELTKALAISGEATASQTGAGTNMRNDVAAMRR